jgi:hypothetical protein
MKIRGVRTELQQAELERVPELTEMLAQLHEAIRRLGERPATPD